MVILKQLGQTIIKTRGTKYQISTLVTSQQGGNGLRGEHKNFSDIWGILASNPNLVNSYYTHVLKCHTVPIIMYISVPSKKKIHFKQKKMWVYIQVIGHNFVYYHWLSSGKFPNQDKVCIKRLNDFQSFKI